MFNKIWFFKDNFSSKIILQFFVKKLQKFFENKTIKKIEENHIDENDTLFNKVMT